MKTMNLDNNPKRVALIAPQHNSLLNFRGDLIQRLLESGFEVYTLAPEYPEDFEKKLWDKGAKTLTYRVNRKSLNPFGDVITALDLFKVIKKNKIDLIIPYTIKPVIYGSIAANWAGVPVVSMITGLGLTFSKTSQKAKILEVFSKSLYKYALRKNKTIVFQNPDDLSLFLEKKIILHKERTLIVNGSGVNLNRFAFRSNRKERSNIKFVFMARLIREKGIELFINGARELKKQYPEAEFHVLGSGSSATSKKFIETLTDLTEKKIMHYHGFTSNVPDFLASCDVFVLPTYYREGIPRSILESLSVGLPIITTDMPGCRETILENKNGILIPPRNQERLTEAMKYFLEHPEQVEIMGLESRKMAETKFDVDLINNRLLETVNACF
ncbi:glycosyltransferase family 4 protein [Robiginitalea sp.]|nr:glycosyltransferase family 4 protein [Robiginitalea sp.]